MTNKELFEKLSKEQQLELVKTLASFDKAHVEFYNGEYHIHTSFCIRVKYEDDFKVLNTFTTKEFYPHGINKELDWYYFWNEKERNGEENECYEVNGEIHGKWQDEFEESYLPIHEEAIKNYLQ